MQVQCRGSKHQLCEKFHKLQAQRKRTQTKPQPTPISPPNPLPHLWVLRAFGAGGAAELRKRAIPPTPKQIRPQELDFDTRDSGRIGLPAALDKQSEKWQASIPPVQFGLAPMDVVSKPFLHLGRPLPDCGESKNTQIYFAANPFWKQKTLQLYR